MNVTPSSGVTREVSGLVPTTPNPAATSASAVSYPMPDDAPVTSATGRSVVNMTPAPIEKPIGFRHCKLIGFHG
jgi:hypothetical protein